MKNLLKDQEPMYMFKPNCLEYDTDYEIEVNGNTLIYKTYPKPKFITCEGHPEPEPELKDYPKPFMGFSNLLFNGDPIPDSEPITFGTPFPRYGFEPKPHRISDIRETLSIEAIHVAKGIARIRKLDGDADTPWIPIDDLVTVEHRKSIDFNKIKPGQIWKLTIDGDPRFQNTLVMILGSFGDKLRFVYQTTVIYTTDYQQTDTAEGSIELYDRSTGNMNNIDIVHLELITDNTNPDGATMDRTQCDKFLYPSSFTLGYQEHYPALPPRERRKRIMDDDDLDE